VQGALVAALVVALPTVTAGAAVRGSGSGNGNPNGAANGNGSDDKGKDNSGHGNGNGTGNGNAPGQTPAATPGANPTAVPPGQAQREQAAGTTTAPGQPKKTPDAGTTTTTTTPGQSGSQPGSATAAPTPVAPAAAPVLGSSMGVAPVTGKVQVRLPNSSGYVSLADPGSIPTGSVIDARKGTLTLQSALDAAGHVQTATVRGAVFEVRQSRTGDGVTDLVLKGGAPASCAGTGAAARAAGVTAAKPKPGALWARDSHGRFRTRGRNSVATVRGTRWSTRETCAGTVTRVMQGAVDVRDLRSGKTVTVRRGHAYLARTQG
jgi:hypothetical protein